MQAYPGTNPVTPWISYTFTTGYGIWPTPLNATDGDDRFAAQLMAAVQALTDRANLVGWRVAYLNPIDGSTSTFTAAIITKNAWSWTGNVELASTGVHRFKGTVYLQNGKTFNVGDTGAGGVGHVVVNPGSDINLDGSGASIADFIATGANARIQVASGALFQVTAAGIARIQGNFYQGLNGDDSTATTVYHPLVHSGTAGRRELRVATLPSGGGAFTASHADKWLVPATSASRTWTPDNEPGVTFEYAVECIENTTQGFDNFMNLHTCTATFKVQSGTTTQGAVHVTHYGASDTHRIDGAWDGLMLSSNSGKPLVVIS